MTSVPAVVLDACVLANFALCDTLLRLAEPPRLFNPRWSDEIMRETLNTLTSKLGWPASLAAHLDVELRSHFSESWIGNYEHLIPRITNHPKDRHVVAAAIQAEALLIVTLNLRHFTAEHLKPWGVRAIHPQVFLTELLNQEPALVIAKLEQQAADRRRSLPQLLDILKRTVPAFVVALPATS